ncbi:hypothetical protein QFZ83_005130 [Variovorax sp. W1I1]|uniref:hypothetical protein n=1 Tax=Variovorax sp. W1I1 TaxID=3042309 RepID=UPI002782AFA8|nr:hypothetical protein [Variovorax sp. W1I1]MDQ0610959.1 hypothetical protein [Variovorax sp. W1I1]
MQADVAAAQRLAASGMIEVTLEVQGHAQKLARELAHVDAIICESASAIAIENPEAARPTP